MKTLWQDARYGLRMLMKKPGFTLIAVITLALGIGATSVIFSFVNGILLRPLPYRDSDRLVLLDETAPKRGIASMGVSYPDFLDWREQNRVFTGVAAYDGGWDYTLTGIGEPEELLCAWVSYNAFEILGVAPILGRTFTAEEEGWKNGLVVILSHDLWVRRFGAKPDVIGRTIALNTRSHTVIGVMPPGFKFPKVADLWVPMPPVVGSRTDHGWSAIARLKPGVTFEQAQSDMTAVARHIEEQNPDTNEGLGVKLIPLREGLAGDYRKALLILMGVVGLVLLIACVNVANLLLARASARTKEVAIRTALGAGRWRVFRQLLMREAPSESSLTVEGYPALPPGQAPMANNNVITPDYFRTMGIPLLIGRDFNDADTGDSMSVTIIDERLAREYWPNESPIGKRITLGPPEDKEPWYTIVGVVGAIKNESLNLTRRKTVYVPHAQYTTDDMSLAIRARNPENLAPAIQRQVKAMNPDLPIINMQTMTEVISDSIWQPRLYAILFGVFAAVALALASVGLYGVMAYSVSERKREIGIRVALGAQHRDMLKLVVAQGMTLTLIGIGIGLAAALALTRLMRSLLFEVSVTDPLTFAGLAALLSVVALLACYLPARRATKVDPMVSLKCE